MAVDINQARALCTGAEFQLYAASRPEQIKTHTPGRLKSKIQRARSLRDKYRDLYKRQRLATRGRTGTKKGNEPDRNARTERKAKLFAEVLERLQKQEVKLAAGAKKAAAKTSTPARAGSGKSGTAATKSKAKVKSKATPEKKATSQARKTKGATTGSAAQKRKAAPKSGAKPTARTASAATKKKPAKRAAGVSATSKGPAKGYQSSAAAGANRRQQQQKTRSKAVMGHTSAAGKRSQARRDSRR